MRILGLKLTHDAAVTLLDDDRLVFSTEIEKLNNNPRYSGCTDLAQVDSILDSEGVDPDSIDSIVVDGWKGGKVLRPEHIPVAPYHDFDIEHAPLLRRREFAGLRLGGRFRRYASYTHVAGHVMGSWAVSPLAASGSLEPFYSLTWDGGQQPRLHRVDPANNTVDFVRALHEYYGIIYGIMGYYFGPFKRPEVAALDPVRDGPLFGGYEAPGKLMSFIALGQVNEHAMLAALRENRDIEAEFSRRPAVQRFAYAQDGVAEHRLCRAVAAAAHVYDISDADALATIHHFLEWLLVSRIKEWTRAGSHLIFSGGSALNIKWNSALRSSGHFASVFVPPVPNDSGSSLGAAAAEMVYVDGWRPLRWSVYAGPKIATPLAIVSEGAEWDREPCSPEEVGILLAARPREPIVVLSGRAEIGPRALGHRSIFAHPGWAQNKDRLNAMKKREPWRPVAPICLEEEARSIFLPGTPDPFMLFDHVVRNDWRERIPAIVHLDGTARLQTISEKDCPVVTAILRSFHSITGIPLLCNTSANRNGSGFFPSVDSALSWAAGAGCLFVWHDGELYSRRR